MAIARPALRSIGRLLPGPRLFARPAFDAPPPLPGTTISFPAAIVVGTAWWESEPVEVDFASDPEDEDFGRTRGKMALEMEGCGRKAPFDEEGVEWTE